MTREQLEKMIEEDAAKHASFVVSHKRVQSVQKDFKTGARSMLPLIEGLSEALQIINNYEAHHKYAQEMQAWALKALKQFGVEQ